MAQSLSIKDGPAKAERTTRRHIRLTKRTKNPEAIAIAERAEPLRATLKAKMDAQAAAEEALQDFFDDWAASDREGDHHISSLDRKARDYDADNPGATTQWLIFQSQAPSDITYMNRAEQPDVVVKLIQRGQSLPPEHPAHPVITQLEESNERTRASYKAYVAAETELTRVKAEVQMAKLEVVKVYRDNIIDITRAVGEALAERCFPEIRSPARKKKES